MGEVIGEGRWSTLLTVAIVVGTLLLVADRSPNLFLLAILLGLSVIGLGHRLYDLYVFTSGK
ncbi:hypothetical protein [Halarchaeum acidiphilum]|uniref:hypothetical protein n=1 Tax=Halarchaeum acidiphilum TaxID=489138 RepID=UPI00035D648F|nr:hypothetical protein [Halarchaeum acidiphilum]